MALYRYLKRHSDDELPDPRGPLSIKIPSTSANVEVRRVVSQEPASWGPYAKFTAEQRTVIGKRQLGLLGIIYIYSTCRFACVHIRSKGVVNNNMGMSNLIFLIRKNCFRKMFENSNVQKLCAPKIWTCTVCMHVCTCMYVCMYVCTTLWLGWLGDFITFTSQ